MERHPSVQLALAELILLVVVVADGARLRNALNLHGDAATTPIVVGVSIAGGYVGLGLWAAIRRSALPRPARRWVARIMWIGGAAAFGSFAWFHPRQHVGSDTPATTFAIANVAFWAGLCGIGMIIVPVLLWVRRRRLDDPTREHAVADTVEVWHVRDRDKRGGPPYFIASCECGWFGVAHGESEAGAEAAAFSDAKSHGTSMRAELTYPMD